MDETATALWTQLSVSRQCQVMMTPAERIEALERMLADYAAKYGLSDDARKYFAENSKPVDEAEDTNQG